MESRQTILCPHCGVNLSAIHLDTSDQFMPDIPAEQASFMIPALPPRVARRYLETLKVQACSPTACAILAGSVLEAICAHEQVPGNTLPEKLASLAQCRHVPPLLLDMAQMVRYLRNIGSHEGEEDIISDDIPAMLAALQALLEYLYVLPIKLTALEERLRQHSAGRKKKAE